MILQRIWERYIFFATLRTFTFFLFCFYVVYIIVDFSTQSVRFYSETAPTIIALIIYYLCQFVKYLDVFFPLAFLFTIIKVFSDMNTKNEFVALQTAGISSKTLTRPLFYFAVLLIIGGYINYELLIPSSMQYISEFRSVHKKDAQKDKSHRKIHVIPLQDDSKLVFAKTDLHMQKLEDIYWIANDSVWHFKTLDLSGKVAIATFPDRFKRNAEKLLVKTDTYKKISLPQIQLVEDLEEHIMPTEFRPLSHLFHQWRDKKHSTEEERNDLLTQLHYKLTNPFFSLLILLLCVPYTMKFSRHIPLFFISASCLFVFVIFYTFMDAALILAENQVVSPFTAIWGPFMVSLLLSTWNFSRQS